jgi:peptidoglycan/LPS O-acetylase OafA/YrhL
MNKTTTSHYPALDGVRGIACLMVVLSHLDAFVGALTSPTHGYSQHSIIWQAYRRIINGNFPVCVFFVLSGYVLLVGYAKRRDTTSLSVGFIKRYLRLTPLVLVSIMGACAIGEFIGFSNTQAAQAIGGHEWLAGHYSFQFSFSHALEQALWGVYQGDVTYNGPLWTLSIELWGSLFIFAFAALFFEQKKFPVIAVIAIIALVATLGTTGVYAGLFVYGALLLNRPALHGNWYLTLPAAYLAMENPWTALSKWTASTLADWHINIGAPPDAWFHAIAAGLLISAVLGSARLKRFFAWRPFVWLGEISFSLYVCHIPVMMSLGAWALAQTAHTGHLRIGSALGIIVTLGASTAIAAVLNIAVDQPSQRFASFIGKCLIMRRPVPAMGMQPD